MNKMKMHTPNLADENYRKLAALFPNAVTESVDPETGEVVRAIDADVLRQEISGRVVEGREERYQFTWPDKKKAMLAANAPIAATLRPVREDSVGKDGTPGGWDSENLYIEGDNLDVLKLLQETYLGNNMGYEGDLELAIVPESFRTDVLGEALDANNVLIENANTETVNFALLFEFDGDIRKIRHVLYNCAASRPNVESKTNEEEVEVQTETLSIKATPMASGIVKAKTGDDTTDSVYQNWYQSVYLPQESAAAEPGNG